MKAEAELQRKLQEEESKKPKFERPPSYTHERKHPLPSNNALLYGKVTAGNLPQSPSKPQHPVACSTISFAIEQRISQHFPKHFSHRNENWDFKTEHRTCIYASSLVTLPIVAPQDWTARVPLHEGEDAFARFDVNQDEKVDWNEWKSQMFHEEPQRAQYKDGQKIRWVEAHSQKHTHTHAHEQKIYTKKHTPKHTHTHTHMHTHTHIYIYTHTHTHTPCFSSTNKSSPFAKIVH